MIRTLAIGAVLWIAAGVAGWALARYAERLALRAEAMRRHPAGKGNATASGSPGQDEVRRD